MLREIFLWFLFLFVVDAEQDTKNPEKTQGFVIIRKLAAHAFPLPGEIEKLVCGFR
jgi:hypothetical protein